MGKKKRYIHRTRKFGTKAFRFLDRVDGTADSILSDARIDDIIESITLTNDRGNQTVALNCRLLGADFTDRHVRYIITEEGGSTHTVDVSTVTAVGDAGRDKFTAPAAAGGAAAENATGVVILPAGNHSVVAQAFAGDGANGLGGSLDPEKELTVATDSVPFKIIRSEISIADPGGATPFAAKTNAGNIEVNLANLTISGKQPGVEDEYEPVDGVGKGGHGFKLSGTVKSGDDEAAALAADAANLAFIDDAFDAGGAGDEVFVKGDDHNITAAFDVLDAALQDEKYHIVSLTLTARSTGDDPTATTDLPDTLTVEVIVDRTA